MGEHDYITCINTTKVEALDEKLQRLVSRMDRVEEKTDNMREILKDLKEMQGRMMFMLIGALGTALLNIAILFINK